MSDHKHIVSRHQTFEGSQNRYIAGYLLSVILTLIPFAVVMNFWLEGTQLIVLLLTFAVVQLFVQLHFFLHLGQESKPRWKLMMFLFAALVVVILVIGSLWIMSNLNYNMMPSEVEHHIMDEEGIHR